jgi:hypothetical protein
MLEKKITDRQEIRERQWNVALYRVFLKKQLRVFPACAASFTQILICAQRLFKGHAPAGFLILLSITGSVSGSGIKTHYHLFLSSVQRRRCCTQGTV